MSNNSIPVLTQVISEPQPLQLSDSELSSDRAGLPPSENIKVHDKNVANLEADVLWMVEHALQKALPPLMKELEEKISRQVVAEVAVSLRR